MKRTGPFALVFSGFLNAPIGEATWYELQSGAFSKSS
jgi:hypothetical protein